MYWRTEFETESIYTCSCLPLFANEVQGFFAEEHISPLFWRTGNPEQDPWGWREIIPSTGYGVEGYKTFDGCITQLQTQTYLLIRKFELRRNKRGQSYGMAVSYYQKPEELWDYEHVTSAYKEESMLSAERIFTRARELSPYGSDATHRKVLK